MDVQIQFENAATHNRPEDLEEVSRLLENSASNADTRIDIEYSRFDGGFQTPLMQAILSNHMEMAELLVLYGADCNARCRDGRCKNQAVIHVAIDKGISFMRMLLRNGASVDILDSIGNNLLHYIVGYRSMFFDYPSITAELNAEKVQKLKLVLAHSTDPEKLLKQRQSGSFCTPLELAVEGKMPEVITFLQNEAANIRQANLEILQGKAQAFALSGRPIAGAGSLARDIDSDVLDIIMAKLLGRNSFGDAVDVEPTREQLLAIEELKPKSVEYLEFLEMMAAIEDDTESDVE
jgi:ankyrin repeat protein